MDKCYHTWDKEVGKVLVPHCLAVVHSGDMSDCICDREPKTFEQFERQEYNEKLNEQATRIRALEKEVGRLNRILKRVKGFR